MIAMDNWTRACDLKMNKKLNKLSFFDSEYLSKLPPITMVELNCLSRRYLFCLSCCCDYYQLWHCSVVPCEASLKSVPHEACFFYHFEKMSVTSWPLAREDREC